MSKLEDAEKILDLSFVSKPDRLKLVRSVVRDSAALCGCSSDCAEDIVIAVNEACMNVIQHAYNRHEDGKIVLEIWKNGGAIVFRLVDFADPIDVKKVKPRDLDDLRPGGLGTHFIEQIMDEMAFLSAPEGAGNMLHMSKRIT